MSSGIGHHCIGANCQIYPDGTRRRNPGAGEPDAATTIPAVAAQDQYSKEAQYG